MHSCTLASTHVHDPPVTKRRLAKIKDNRKRDACKIGNRDTQKAPASWKINTHNTRSQANSEVRVRD